MKATPAEGRSWLVRKAGEAGVQFGTRRASGDVVWAKTAVRLRPALPDDWTTCQRYAVVAAGHTLCGEIMVLVQEELELWALDITPSVDQTPAVMAMAPVPGGAMDRFFKGGGGYVELKEATAAAKKRWVAQARASNQTRDHFYRVIGQWANTQPRQALRLSGQGMWITVNDSGEVSRPGQDRSHPVAWTKYGVPHAPPQPNAVSVLAEEVRPGEYTYPPEAHLTFRVQAAGRPIMQSMPVTALPTAFAMGADQQPAQLEVASPAIGGRPTATGDVQAVDALGTILGIKAEIVCTSQDLRRLEGTVRAAAAKAEVEVDGLHYWPAPAQVVLTFTVERGGRAERLKEEVVLPAGLSWAVDMRPRPEIEQMGAWLRRAEEQRRVVFRVRSQSTAKQNPAHPGLRAVLVIRSSPDARLKEYLMAFSTVEQAWAATNPGYGTVPTLQMKPREGRLPVRCTQDRLGVIVGAAGVPGIPKTTLLTACAANIRRAALVVHAAHEGRNMAMACSGPGTATPVRNPGKQPLGAGSQGEAADVQAQQHAELNGKLRLLGLALDEATKVDGDCLPDAVARMLRSHPELYLSAGGPQEMTHETVRAGIVKWVDENLNTQYTPQVFNDADVGEGSWTVEELIQAILIPEMRAGVPPRPHVQTVTDYLAEIARHGTYADQLSLVAAASTYGLALTIVSSRPGTEHTKVNPTNQPASRSVFLAHRVENHYMAVKQVVNLGPPVCRRTEPPAAAAQAGGARVVDGGDDEAAQLAAAMAMSMDEGAPAPAPAPAPPAPAGGNDDMNLEDIDDPELRMALQMSMQDVP